MALIQEGNSKLKAANIAMFNLPATKQVCGRICKGCYAVREQKRYPSVLPAREARLEAADKDDFVATVQGELDRKRKRPKYFRVHSSGEFYSQEYISKWVTLAKQNKDIIFYAYTKRKGKFDFSELEQLSNFILINSFHFGRKNYGPEHRVPEGAFVCPAVRGSDINCGVECTYCMTKDAQKAAPFFLQH